MILLYFESDFLIDSIKSALEKTFGDVELAGTLIPPTDAFDSSRDQLSGEALINNFPTLAPSLWVVDKDIYLKTTKFVFGFALRNRAILSTFRLDKNTVGKQAIHEVGHALGLTHCLNDCVMNFSKNIDEAKNVSGEFCSHCKRKLNL